MSSGASTSESILKSFATAKVLFDKVKAKVATMSRPAKVLSISTAVFAIAIIGFFGWKSTDVSYTTLFTNLDREDAAAVIAKLKESKTPYKIGEDGSTIAVPDDKARELRLELAGAGLPRGGGVGFESFDKMRLGATEFEQRVLYRRSLEGELGRTIDTISAVQSTRVHLVLPERSVFVGQKDPASASVVLKLRGGRSLGPAEVSGIVHLVSSSVAGLAPEHVAVMTTEGTVLHKPRREGEVGGGGDDDQAAGARALEASLEERARAMLEKVVGAGHVDVRVTADVDRSRVERVEDHYDPKQVMRSEQRTIERSAPTEATAAGVPGTESNLPGGSARVDGGAPMEGAFRESSTKNFEVDHVTEKRLVLGGTVRRITVAVVVDDAKGVRSKEDVERLTALVRSAVGADDRRGDVVTVDSQTFLAPDPTPAPPPVPQLIPEQFKKYVPYGIGGVLAVVLFGIVTITRRARARARKEAASKALALAAPMSSAPPPVDEDAMAKLEPEELRTAAHDNAARDPATAALVLRFWLGAGVEEGVTGPSVRALNDGTSIA